jgi:hypothetical protein
MHPAILAVFKKALKHSKLKKLFLSRRELRTEPPDIYGKDSCGFDSPYAWLIEAELRPFNMGGCVGNHGQHSVHISYEEVTKNISEAKRATEVRDKWLATKAKISLAERQAVELAIAQFKTTPEYQKLAASARYADAMLRMAEDALRNCIPEYSTHEGRWYTRDELKQLLKGAKKPRRNRGNRKRKKG